MRDSVFSSLTSGWRGANQIENISAGGSCITFSSIFCTHWNDSLPLEAFLVSLGRVTFETKFKKLFEQIKSSHPFKWFLKMINQGKWLIESVHLTAKVMGSWSRLYSSLVSPGGSGSGAWHSGMMVTGCLPQRQGQPCTAHRTWEPCAQPTSSLCFVLGSQAEQPPASSSNLWPLDPFGRLSLLCRVCGCPRLCHVAGSLMAFLGLWLWLQGMNAVFHLGTTDLWGKASCHT